MATCPSKHASGRWPSPTIAICACGADSALNTGEPGPRARNHRSTDLRLPLPGTVLTRSFKGKTVKVCVLPDGFRYQDRRFRSLSAVAEHITGTRWNGYVFFSLQNRRSARRG